MATMADVARRAGVSAMTVSRVINGHANVSEKVRVRVLRAIQELDYRPNMLARALTTSRTGTVGVLIADIENHMYSRFVSSISRHLQQQQIDVLLYDAETDAAFHRGITTLVGKRVDGIIMLPFEYESAPGADALNKADALFAAEGIPCVYLCDARDGGERNQVLIDYEQGAYMATRQLIDLGHRRVGMLGNTEPTGLWRHRYRGFHRALDEAGIQFDRRFALYADEDLNDVVERARVHLDGLDDLPTAYYGGNDLRAAGMLRVLWERGLRVPEDISVIGHDGNIYGEYTMPPLTTVSLNPKACGEAAVEMLLGILGGALPHKGNERVIGQVAVRGATVGDARGAAPGPCQRD